MADPTNKHNNRLINTLRNIKTHGGLEDITYKRLSPTGAGPGSNLSD